MSPSVLYDGWPLVRQPLGPAAVHLSALLAVHPVGVDALLALPEEPPDWLSTQVVSHVLPLADSPASRLRWEQRLLPALGEEVGADCIHMTSMGAPFFSRLPVLVSPTGYGTQEEPSGLRARLLQSIGIGGAARASAWLWPSDLPAPQPAPVNQVSLSPLVHPVFFQAAGGRIPAELQASGLPETYILYHGPGSFSAMRFVLEAWSWAALPLGGGLPLLLLGLTDAVRQQLKDFLAGSDLEKTVIALGDCSPGHLPWIYQHCEAYFHPASVSPWGDAVRQALACGKPVVAAASPGMDALVGSAAYLAPGDDRRALGAALLSVIVETSLGEELANKARQRAEEWSGNEFVRELGDFYLRLASG